MLMESQDLECCAVNFFIIMYSSFSIGSVCQMRSSMCSTNIIECVLLDQVHCLGVILDCQSSNKNDFILADIKRTAALISSLINGLQFPR